MTIRPGFLSLILLPIAFATSAVADGVPKRGPATLQPPPHTVAGPLVGAAAAGSHWAETFGGGDDDESADLIRETSDGGFVLSGSNGSFLGGKSKRWLLKVDPSGSRLWETVLTTGLTSTDLGYVQPLDDGGYLFDVQSYSSTVPIGLTVGKLDANGAIVWQKQLEGATSLPTNIVPLADGGFLLFGISLSAVGGGLGSEIDVARIGPAGTILWQETITAEDSLRGSPVILSDGSILCVGTRTPLADPTNPDGWMMMLDGDGNVLWDELVSGAASDSLVGATETTCAVVVYGTTKSFGSGGADLGDIWVLKVDPANGAILAQKTFGGPDDESGFLLPTSDGFLLSGVVKPGTASDGFVAKLGGDLSLAWAKTYDAGGTEEGIYATVDGDGYLLQGSTDNTNFRMKDILVARADSTGTPLWAHLYGGGGDDTGYAVRLGSGYVAGAAASAQAVTDNDIMLAGTTASYGAGGTDGLLARLDANGGLSGCSFVHDLTLTATPWAMPNASSDATVTPVTPTIGTLAFSLSGGNVESTPTSSLFVDVCSGFPQLTATSTASSDAGDAPLTVSFTGSAANGIPPYTYAWDFGDGSTSSQQNPSHTFNSPGVFSVVLTVTDSTANTASDTHITITVHGECQVSCSATVPASGTAGEGVDFAVDVQSSGCTDAPTYSWTFGDGGTSAQQNPSHTYATAGSYDWSVTVQRGSSSCTSNGSIDIASGSGGGGPVTFWVLSIAHLKGAGTSRWRSNIAATNRSGSTAHLTLVFVPYGSGSTITRTATLADGGTVEWSDLLLSLFGFSDTTNTKGTVKITSDVPISVVSRTYNEASTGTFGQYYPALVATDAITSGQKAVLPLLKKNSGFRTNIGFQNLGSGSCTGTIKLYNAAGVQVGSTRTLTAAADKYIQDDDIFSKSGAGNQDVAYAVVEVTTSGGKAWFYASVIDSSTNDPTTVPPQ
jgi:PKD repeat protein